MRANKKEEDEENALPVRKKFISSGSCFVSRTTGCFIFTFLFLFASAIQRLLIMLSNLGSPKRTTCFRGGSGKKNLTSLYSHGATSNLKAYMCRSVLDHMTALFSTFKLSTFLVVL